MATPGDVSDAPPRGLADVTERHWASMSDRGSSETQSFIQALASRFGIALDTQADESFGDESGFRFGEKDEYDLQDAPETGETSHWAPNLLALPVMSNDRHAPCSLEIEAGVIAQAVLDGDWQLGRDIPTEALQQLVVSGRAALDEMLVGNIRLALYWANRYARGDSDSAQDLFQEAFEGLFRAIEGWDALRGYTFATYASWHIRQRIQRGLDGPVSKTPVHIPVHVLESQRATSRKGSEASALERLAHRWQKERISWELIAEEVPELTSLCDSNPIDELITRICLVDSVGQCLAYLSERDADILVRRFGLLDEPETLDSIAQSYGVTRERIRQMEKKALIELQLHIASLEAFSGRITNYLARTDRGLARQVDAVLGAKCLTIKQISRILKAPMREAETVFEAITEALSAITPSHYDLPRIWLTPTRDDPVFRRISDFW